MVSMIALIVSMVALAVGFLIAINGILSDGLKGLRQKGKPIIAALIVYAISFLIFLFTVMEAYDVTD